MVQKAVKLNTASLQAQPLYPASHVVLLDKNQPWRVVEIMC